ncbi:peptidyl-prolyl cis-trans isomerase FKBP4-like [Xenia sp. Carnegie-2017]|uniref:peptidyl-prolyl cis-trans isomerase FKBP4-like n=1 Tax=Xenia sp. Carnegie-2017 TaxID=2897299 RepID=UPI001F036A8F|nr:peptidyl-prolyl cis-trans isomerase FKBP4-like [Xenia sp. Carnegie-2017]
MVESVDISGRQDGGVLKVIKKEGYGEDTPCEGATVFVHYLGTLEDGTQFDSSRNRGRPFDCLLGRGHLIPAWELALETMKKGEICVLTCKPEYAYGKVGKPPDIPQNATLIFEIELIRWEDEKVTMDELVTKKILKKGMAVNVFLVHLVGKVDNRIFDDRDVQFTVGEGDLVDVISGVDALVKTMKKGEISVANCDSSYAFGEEGRKEWGIKPSSNVKYEVHLKTFEQLKQPWELSVQDRIEGAIFAKKKGTEYYKEKKFSQALGKYTRMVTLVESLGEERDLKEVSSLILAGHLNVALCYLKLAKYKECIESCDKALCRDKNNIKAIYRKGKAKLDMNYPDEASEMFEKVLRLEPNNKDAKIQLNIAKKMIAENRVKEKTIYANMFEKFAAKDAKKLASEKLSNMNDDKDIFTKAQEEAHVSYEEDLES